MRKIIAISVVLVIMALCAYVAFRTPMPNASAIERATVVYVVDGDTLCVQRENVQGPEKVRLIGIDAPESVAPETYLEEHGKENTQAGVDATEYVKSLVSNGDVVYLEFDEEREDRYGRLLAYVWLVMPDGSTDISTYMLNAILVREGYAEPAAYKPNTRYEQVFSRLA